MRIRAGIAAALALALTAAAPSFAQQAMPAGVKVKSIELVKGGVLKTYANAKDLTLYTCDLDMPGKPACSIAEWNAFWPPLAAAADAKPVGQWTVITNAAGAKQWAFKGKPVYTFAKDTLAHDMNGHEQPKDKPIWRMLQPAG